MKSILLTSVASLLAATAAHAAPLSWTTGTAGDASGIWDGAASTFNGQAYTAADDLFLDGTATKTITLSGTIPSPLSLTVNGTGTTGNTITGNAGNPGAGTITLTGTSVGGTLSKTGNADLVLAAPNSFGAVSLSSGKFFLNHQDGLGITGTLTVNSGAASGVAGSYGTANMGNYFYDSTNINANVAFSKSIDFAGVVSATTYAMVMRGGATRTTTLGGNLSGGSNITLWLDTSASGDGASIWSLTGDNSGFAGTIRLNRGRLFLSNANAGGAGTIFLQSNANTAGNLFFSSAVTAATNLTIGTTANQAISTANGDVTLTGTVSTSGNNTTGGINKVGAGTLTLSGAVTLTGPTALSAGTVAFDGTATKTLSGVVSGVGSMVKTGASTLILSNTANAFSGGVTVNGGELRAQVATPATGTFTNLGTGAVTVNGATLRFMAGSTTNTYTYANTINLNNGTIAFEDGNHILSGTLALTGNNVITGRWIGKNLTLSGLVNGAGSITKDNVGTDRTTLILPNANTYAGGTTINGGTIAVGNNGALGTGNVTIAATAAYGAAYASGGTPFLRSSVTGLTVPNEIALPGTAGYYGLQSGAAAGGTVEWSGTISGGGSGVVLQIDTPNGGDSTSTTTLSGVNTFAGQIRLNRGRVVLANSSAAGTADLFLQSNVNPTDGNLVFGFSGNFANNIIIGATANQSISTGVNNVVLSGAISGTTAWSKAGTGTLTLTGANTFAGVAVNSGTLLVNSDSSATTEANTVAAGATLGGNGFLGGFNTTVNGILQGGDGSTGSTLTLMNIVFLNSTSSIQLALGSTGTHSTLNFNGGYSFDATQDFNFLDLGAAAGTYSSVITGINFDPGSLGDWQILNPGWSGTFIYNPDSQAIDLNLLAVPEPGTALSLLGGLGLLLGRRRRR